MHASRRRLLEQARESGVAGVGDGQAWGYARPGAIRAVGPDAVEWLQSQTTNDVAALAVGDAHLGARVTRTGHLQAVFAVLRLFVTHLFDNGPAARIGCRQVLEMT